jgi:uroporphyrinogen decarboxylase
MCNSFIDWSIVQVKKAASIEGFDAFLIADDWGMTKSLLISPEYLRQFFIHPYKRLVDIIRKLDFPVIMHNDGNIWEVMEDIAGMGVDAYHPVEKAATMDLRVIKQKYKGILCPIGNIDNKKVLVSGTVGEVKKETLRCLREGSEGGGYIISSDHSLHDDMPVENITSYIETVMEYGKYHNSKLEFE